MARKWTAFLALAASLWAVPLPLSAQPAATPPAATATPAAAQPATVQPPDAVAAARSALDVALAQAPFTVPLATFTRERAAGYGIYDKRDTNRFHPGEPMFLYLEPQGYKYKMDGDIVTFGMALDFAVLGKDESILGGKENFLTVKFRSHHHNAEMMLVASITIQNAPPGDYQLELAVHDQSSGDVVHTRLPFTIE